MPTDEPADLEKLKQELRNLFQEREYSRGDVILASGVSEKALEHMTKPRGPLRFVGAVAKHQGRAMKFTGSDILMIEVLRRLNRFGVTQVDTISARELVSRHLRFLIGGFVEPNSDLAIALYPYSTNDMPDKIQWACVRAVEGEQQPWLPPEVLIVNVSRIIDETTAKLRALRDDTEMPRFNPIVEALRHQQSKKPESGQPRGPAASSAASGSEQAAAPPTPTKETKP
jgi:hypothetical protein